MNDFRERRVPNNPFDSQDFRKEFEETIDKKLTNVTAPIVELLKKHDERHEASEAKITEHTNKFREQKGAMWAFGIMWTGLLGLLEYVRLKAGASH